MARSHTKNLANYASLGISGLAAKLSGAAAISFHCLCNIQGTDIGQNDNGLIDVILATTTVGFEVNIDGSGGAGLERRIRCNGRSVSTDARQGRTGTSLLPTNTWIAVGGVMDFANDTITPYYAGVAENGGVATFTNTSFTHAGTQTIPDGFGSYGPGTGSQTTASMFNGYIAEIAVWNTALTAGHMSELGAFRQPLRVRPDALIGYWPWLGYNSPEPDYVGGLNVTVTGSLPQIDHPRVYR